MKRAFLCIALFAAVLTQTGPTAQGCGDKLLALGRGVRFQRAFAAAHPAAVLIYTAQGSRSGLSKDTALQSALKTAGHRLTALDDSKTLQQTLASGRFDIVLTDLSEASGLTQVVRAAPSHPSVVPVMYKPDKAAFAAAGKQYSAVLKAPAKPIDFLVVIDEVMKRRVARVRA